MRARYVAIAWVLVVSCGPAVTHTPIGPRRYAIQAESDGPTGSGELLGLMHRHAARICPHGYDVVSSIGSQRVTGVPVNGVTYVGSRPETGMVVDCRAAGSTAAAVPAIPRWCAQADASDIGFCMETAASCERQRGSFGRPVGACVSAASVHCFDLESLSVEGKQMRQCAPTAEACGRKREVSRRNPQGWAVATECRELH